MTACFDAALAALEHSGTNPASKSAFSSLTACPFLHRSSSLWILKNSFKSPKIDSEPCRPVFELTLQRATMQCEALVCNQAAPRTWLNACRKLYDMAWSRSRGLSRGRSLSCKAPPRCPSAQVNRCGKGAGTSFRTVSSCDAVRPHRVV